MVADVNSFVVVASDRRTCYHCFFFAVSNKQCDECLRISSAELDGIECHARQRDVSGRNEGVLNVFVEALCAGKVVFPRLTCVHVKIGERDVAERLSAVYQQSVSGAGCQVNGYCRRTGRAGSAFSHWPRYAKGLLRICSYHCHDKQREQC